MRITFKTILNTLFSKIKELGSCVGGVASLSLQAVKSASGISPHASQAVETSSKNADSNRIRADRCLRILSYWLDAELFDLPECPLDTTKEIVSEPADKFVQSWGEKAAGNFRAGKLKMTEDSRLLVMFQCHRAGYIATSDERHPNYIIPRTYLVGQALVPRWDKERETILWSRSAEEQDLIVNLATIRTLYRRCPSSVPKNMSLSDWVEARLESIDNILHTALSFDDDSPIDTEDLNNRILKINRELADQFWPDRAARDFMLKQCQPIESTYESERDAPSTLNNGTVTFRWRFCYYPEGSDAQQLGPFFVQDLERTITTVDKSGAKGLSLPLQAYLLGNNEQIEIGGAVNQGSFFWPLTNGLPFGRWPENPEFGLSLLQTVSVNVSRKATENPIVAVNGPPGTGKTTLLKDIIAEHFVIRTHKLRELGRQNNWVSDARTAQLIMQHSIVVASSNNKAVENISKELPLRAKLWKGFADTVSHFKELAPEGDWGLFCAVLGNSTNRNAFKPLLKKLREHMRNVQDCFQLNLLLNSLQKNGKEGARDVFYRLVTSWKDNGRLTILVDDIKKCQAYKKYGDFFNSFTDALILIENSKLSVEHFADSWRSFDDEQWIIALEALGAFKKQWFGKKLYEEHLSKKLFAAENAFNTAYVSIQQLQNGPGKEWQLDPSEHLIGENSYLQHDDESSEDAEKRLQLSSPLGSFALNRSRSELFIKALALNEAILENAASQFSKLWEPLEQLIDGHLQTQEGIPEHQQLWSLLFLFFPVVSTSLSSVENQFKLMQQPGGFGLAMIDEAGQAVNYHVTGLLQRSRQAIFVGDPIQLEPVVTMPPSIDLAIAEDFIPISKKDGEHRWGDAYLVSRSSAQSIADNAGRYMAKIGDRKVGIPLLVHRRCTEPMFSVANRIAYNDRMVLATPPFDWSAIQSGWIHVSEQPNDVKVSGYANSTEANVALELVKYLVEEQEKMVAGGVYIITPFSVMRRELKKLWTDKAKSPLNHQWMLRAFGCDKEVKDVKQFAEDNIGTVHTFQGKEASTVIVCTSASKVRKKTGGITWVNSKPNLLNVAVTRAKHHLFIIGNQDDWSTGTLSSELQWGGMRCYDGLEQFKCHQAIPLHDHLFENKKPNPAGVKVTFDFGQGATSPSD